MKTSVRRLLIANIGVLVVFAGIFVWAMTRLDWHTVGHELREALLAEVALMAGSWIMSLFVRPFRLLALIRAMAPEVECRYWPVWRADLIAMAMNSIIPVRAGDMAMALVLRQGLGLRTTRGFSVVLVDRFFDLLTVAAMFVAALSVAPSVAPWAANLTVTMPLALLAAVFGLWLFVRLRAVWLAIMDKALARFAPGHRQTWGERIHDLFEGLVVINRPSVVVPVIGLSILQWSVMAMSYWFGALSVWPGTPFAAGAFAAGAVALSFAVPTPPGGIGVFHAVTVAALSLFGVPLEASLACALICHAIQLGSVLLLGTVALFSQGMSIRSLAGLPWARS